MERVSSSRPSISDEDIHTTALRVITERGVDQLSIPRIAAAGGFTTAPVYRRFDTADDVLFDLWNTNLLDHFDRLARASTGLARDNADAAWLVDQIMHPSPYSQATIDVMIASRRLGIIGSEIRLQVESVIANVIDLDAESPAVMTIARLTPIIGILLVGPFAPELIVPVLESFQRFADEYQNRAHWNRTSRDIPYSPPGAPTWSTGDGSLDDLRSAVVTVVARHGADGATATRIAREAGRSINSAYRRLGNKEELIADTVRLALRSDFGFSGAENAAAMAFPREERLNRSLRVLRNHIDDRNRTNRTFILEALLAARWEPTLQQAVRSWITGARERFANGIRELDIPDPDSILTNWEFRIVSGFGALALTSVAPTTIGRLDPMPALSANDAATFGRVNRCSAR